MARHYWVTVQPFEGASFVREALTFAGAMDIARREAERWVRGCSVRVESVAVRRDHRTRVEFADIAHGGRFEGEGVR